MRRTSVCFSLVVLAGVLSAASAQAQAPAAGPASSDGTNMGTARFTSANSAHGRGLGIGAATMLNGTSGVLVTWGTSGFHLDGLAGIHRYVDGNSTTSFTMGGRGWYHIHAASFADFSLGGGLGLVRWVSAPGRTGQDTHYDVSLELGAQIRTFIVPNVALLADLGIGITFANNDNILVGGQSMTDSGSPEGGRNFVAGTLGIAYFFE